MAEITRKGAYDASMRTPSFAYGDNFICRHCGAEYRVSYTELPIADSGSVPIASFAAPQKNRGLFTISEEPL